MIVVIMGILEMLVMMIEMLRMMMMQMIKDGQRHKDKGGDSEMRMRAGVKMRMGSKG